MQKDQVRRRTIGGLFAHSSRPGYGHQARIGQSGAATRHAHELAHGQLRTLETAIHSLTAWDVMKELQSQCQHVDQKKTK